MVRKNLLLLIIVAFVVVRPAAADDSDPKLRGRRLSEWVAMLRDDKSPDKRRAALLAVELIGPSKSPQVVTAIIQALTDDADEKVRESAAASLGRIGEKIAARPPSEKTPFTAGRDALRGALRTDPSGRVRAAAATAIGKLEKNDAATAVSELSAALVSPHRAARSAAADTLRRLGKDAAEALPSLRQALEDRTNDSATRTQAALAIGNLGDAALPTLPGLLVVLDDAQSPVAVRKAITEALGRIGPGAAVAASRLAGILTAKDSDLDLRRAAVTALDEFGPEARPVVDSLRKALQDDDRFIRALALHAIGHLGNSLGSESHATVVAVLGCLNDRFAEVRVAAIQTLGALGDERLQMEGSAVRDRLKEAARDSQPAVREAAAELLAKLKSAP